jgi:Ran GTPase-activating protein (RanGAP) involved in mRNA processing and transport
LISGLVNVLSFCFSKAIAANCGLKVLTLKNNKIGDKGLMALAQALETSRNLESISLFGNTFSNECGKIYKELCEQRLAYKNVQIDLSVYVVDDIYQIAEH